MQEPSQIFIGVDISTQGIRVIALDENGIILSSQKRQLPYELHDTEQSPTYWWSNLVESLKNTSFELKKMNRLDQTTAISVTSTSGTVIPLNRKFEPIHDAIMYHDKRSTKEADLCNRLVYDNDYEITFNSSYGLPKMVWFTKAYPQLAEQIYKWCHPSDFIIGKLSGVWGVTESTNALKSGYNLKSNKWPESIENHLSIPLHWFPEVLKTGTVVGNLESSVAQATGLPSTLKVVIGPTDGCASQFASGSVNPGDWSTTIGTTLVIKGVTQRHINDPLGRVYCHKHPDDYWLPGGASNVGTSWINRDFNHFDLEHLNKRAETLTPTGLRSYPLVGKGERFPFVSPNAVGIFPEGLTKEKSYTSNLEGIAYVERLAYELIENLSNEKVERIHTAGGASNSNIWLQIRSNTLQKPIIKMKYTDGAIGAALIAAAGTYFPHLKEAAQQMLHEQEVFEPNTSVQQYEETYQKFKELLLQKRYIN